MQSYKSNLWGNHFPLYCAHISTHHIQRNTIHNHALHYEFKGCKAYVKRIPICKSKNISITITSNTIYGIRTPATTLKQAQWARIREVPSVSGILRKLAICNARGKKRLWTSLSSSTGMVRCSSWLQVRGRPVEDLLWGGWGNKCEEEEGMNKNAMMKKRRKESKRIKLSTDLQTWADHQWLVG